MSVHPNWKFRVMVHGYGACSRALTGALQDCSTLEIALLLHVSMGLGGQALEAQVLHQFCLKSVPYLASGEHCQVNAIRALEALPHGCIKPREMAGTHPRGGIQ